MNHNGDDGGGERPEPTCTIVELLYLAPAVTHRIISSLTAAVSRAEILGLQLRDVLRPEQLEALERVVTVSFDAAGLAQKLAGLAHQCDRLRHAPTELASIVAEAVERLRGEFPRVTWVIDLAPTPMQGDAEALGLMAEALLRNAAEAADVGPRSRTVEVRLASGPTLSIRDDGAGVPEDVRARVFEPFASSREGHRGFGLSLARSIWQRHGGVVSLQPDPSGGTRVTLGPAPA